MSKHTPGRWSNAALEDLVNVTQEALHDLGQGAWNQADIDDAYERTALARESLSRLIAAAPRMYEALRQIVWKLNRNEVPASMAYQTDAKGRPAKIDRNDIVIKQAQELLDELEPRT